MKKNRCLVCKTIMEGRTDKKFCSMICKSKHHYDRNLQDEASLYNRIDTILKQNRRILKEYNKGGKATVRKEVLIKEGFNPKFFTHYWKNSKSEIYLFCYEYGFIERTENGKQKYVLVQWQEYMSNNA